MSLTLSLIDTHCHLDEESFSSQQAIGEVIQEAHVAGVETLINISTSLENLPHVQKLSETYPNVYHSIGVHPEANFENYQAILDGQGLLTLEQASAHPHCKAIGEIGLDYYHCQKTTAPLQQDLLHRQLELALQQKLPVIIHSREAETSLLPLLNHYAHRCSSPPGVIHCFTGSLEFARNCLDLGFYISFSGILTFKKADQVRQVARFVPEDRLLIETDAPFLAPVPHRGKQCTPSMVIHTAKQLAELRNKDLPNLAQLTTDNAKQLFRISSPTAT